MSESPTNLDFANTGFFTPANFWSIGTVSWEKPWSHIVAGKFSSSPYDGLFCYSAILSVGAFYSTDGAGHIQLISENFQDRQFTHVATGIFDDSGFAGILLYDQVAGVANFYSTDGKGSLTLLQSHNDWRKTWTHIVAAPFVDSPHTALLLYDQTHGYGAIFATDGRGGVSLVEEHTNWRTTWTLKTSIIIRHPFLRIFSFSKAALGMPKPTQQTAMGTWISCWVVPPTFPLVATFFRDVSAALGLIREEEVGWGGPT
jgi:hypothetical protein